MNAIKNLNNKEEACSLFTFDQSYNKHLRNSTWYYKLLIDKYGNNRLDIIHPKLSERVNYIKNINYSKLNGSNNNPNGPLISSPHNKIFFIIPFT